MTYKSFVFTFLFVLSTGSHSAQLPPEFTATYEVKKGFVVIGEAVRKLRKNKGKWTYISDSRTTGFIGSMFSEHIVQTTEFEFKNGLIRPLIYKYTRNKGQKNVLQTYNWDKMEVFSQRDEKSSTYAIPEKVQDQSIYQLSVMLDLADGLRDFTYHVAENVRLVDYQVKYKGIKTVKSRLGKYKTHVVEVKGKKNKTRIFCAQKLHNLPLKIEFEEGGTSFIAWLKRIEGF